MTIIHLKCFASFILSHMLMCLMTWRSRPGDLKWQLGKLNECFGAFKSACNKTRSEHSPIISDYTKHQRIKILRLFIDMLHACGYGPQFLDSIGVRHVKAVVARWVEQGLVTRTLQTRLSAVRMLFAWIGRDHVLPGNRELLPRQHRRSRCVATRDKSWEGNGLDFHAIILKVPVKYLWVRFSLELQRMYGLRVKESLLLHPHEADAGDVLHVWWGSKNARPRDVPIETAAQRDLLDRIKAVMPPGQALIGPRGSIKLSRTRGQHDRVVRHTLGISKKATGCTSHGLRFGYLCEQYEKFTGEPGPIKGGRPIDPALDRAGREYVAKLAGHNRHNVASAYLGAVLKKSKSRA
jgi:site-specific recombinase XerC